MNQEAGPHQTLNMLAPLGQTKGCIEQGINGLPHWQGNLPDSKSLRSCAVARNTMRYR